MRFVALEFECIPGDKVLGLISYRQPHLTLDDLCLNCKRMAVRRNNRIRWPDTFENLIEALGEGLIPED